MKLTKLIVILLAISLISVGCNKKGGEESTTKKTKTAKKVDPVQAQIAALNAVFSYGDKLIKEREGYQKELSNLLPAFKKMKTPFGLKANSKYKAEQVSQSFFTGSVWTTIYKDSKQEMNNRLFWVTVAYRDNYTEKDTKWYKETFAGLPAKHYKNKWVWVLVDGQIEIRVSPYKEMESDKAMEEVLKEFDIEAIKTVFKEKSAYPELKEYLLKVKAIKAKIAVVNEKFKKEENKAIEAIKPFLPSKTGVYKDYNFDNISYSILNSYSIYMKKDGKIAASIYIRPKGKFANSAYTLKQYTEKILNFPASIKEKSVKVRLDKLVVEASAYTKKQLMGKDNLTKIVKACKLVNLSKIK